ncbi:MAG TPA: 2-oxoacid:acceptor oxidoreductase subunit alpha [Saprospiraceae bacterium]|nr:2-oxoacid:acceptor oxidoreductase subunit alpha [Saprospiraceae bacterium]HMQ84892.1 2-oxoacid:acceptor oxidoreductase subunit alpha [Saprospiraceae bacterium]
MSVKTEIKEEVTIKFAGDSGDGMQLTGSLFTDNTALEGSDLATFPDFPAEIRAPQGTLAGVSGFQLHFGSRRILTPGDEFDVLVAMNAAALKSNLGRLKPGSLIIANTDGFDSKNLRLAKYPDGINPLEDNSLSGFEVMTMPVTKLTMDALKEFDLGKSEKERSKNMFVLGFLYWKYNRKLDSTISYLSSKFKRKSDILEANLYVLKAGYHYGETTETFTTTYKVNAAPLEKGIYRSIMGNEALSIGLIAAAKKAGLSLFYGSYPITPASDILHYLSARKNFGVVTFQAEDEIAAICSAIGAAYGGNLAITGTSGPGMALKAEAMGLALMLELPLVICDIQRGGPSTGLPTKTEQSDLMQALYGRNGESPMPVIAAKSPSDCFYAAFEACRIALQHMVPVILLSDGYIANGAEPWMFPSAADLPEIKVQFAPPSDGETPYLPYLRNEDYVREWALPGTAGLAHRIGGLEKEANTGNVSYDPANHEYMVKIREAKVEKIADHIPPQSLEVGSESGDILVLGWGSTYGVIKSVVSDLVEEGHAVAHAHLRHLRPFPKNLESLLKQYQKVVIPEINNGQLSKVIRQHFLLDVIPYNKIQGVPITKSELKAFVQQLL